jgi:serine/threonine protein kinase
MQIEPGSSLLHYRIVDKIGEGGMGVGWKAVDTTLDRTVAIKVLPQTFREEPERLARFEREAKSLAALNHPNVASLFGLHEFEGASFITMEFVEGEDLSKRIQRGALSVEEALPIAIGIAEALVAAHARGIVHRDLKPANVLIDTEGVPKVLDFGLAKTAMADTMSSGGGDASNSPTITSLGTVAGVLLGTAAYMSPEQARGKPVDKRADTWALGCILYEMLTGSCPFPGETISDTLASVLKSEPDWEALPASTPSSFVAILKRSLAKSARDRWQDAGDLRYELENAAIAEGEVVAPSQRATGRFGLLALAVTLVGGLALGLVIARALSRPVAAQADVTAVRTVSEISTEAGIVFGVKAVDIALSPDGSQLAYAGVDSSGRSSLYVRSLSGGRGKQLPGTEGATQPFWSPDGTQVAFHTSNSIWRIGLNDPKPQQIADQGGKSGTWSGDVVLYCAQNVAAVQRVDISTGRQSSLAITAISSDGYGCDSVSFLPDGRHFLLETRDSGREWGVIIAAIDSEELTKINSLKTNAVYSAGHMLFHDGPQLMALQLDPKSYQPVGEPFVVAAPVFELNFPFHGLFTAARDRKRVVYLEGTGESLRTELTWFNRQGEVLERTGIVGDLYNPELSRDGRRLLIDVSTYETEGDIWLFDLTRGSSRRLTDDPIDESRPMWSPDETVAYFFRVPDLYRMDLTGNSPAERVLTTGSSLSTSSVSREGLVAYTETIEGENLNDIGYFDPSIGEATAWLATPANEREAMFSPDGGWLVYQSDESGRSEVYVDRFPNRGERFQVSTDGGTNPRWRADGEEIFFVSSIGEIVAVSVDLSSERRPFGEPVILFRPKIRRDMYTVDQTGERFLVVERLDPEIRRAVLIDHWE